MKASAKKSEQASGGTGRVGAAALIAAAKAKSVGVQLSDAAVADIREVCEHNRTAHRHQRVKAMDVTTMLAEVHGVRISRDSLDDWCRRHYGAPFGSVHIAAVQK